MVRMTRFVCMGQCSALRAKYMREHPQIYADAINRHHSQSLPVTIEDVIRLAEMQDAIAANHKVPLSSLPLPECTEFDIFLPEFNPIDEQRPGGESQQ